ncbi:MAG TPA: PASTA domain-containing protein [Gemmatimonadales bacterium]|nr:PASTA domain-containing protein [Gemmatimonadales bacterium]
MRIRRHVPSWEGFTFDRHRARKWVVAGLGAILAGYLTAYLVLFPAPILRGHQAVPRVLTLTLPEAQAEVKRAQLQVSDGGAEPHPTAPQGVVIWQDPPPGVIAPEGAKVTLVSSAGPPKIPVPDVAGLETGLAQTLVAAAGLVVSQVESVQAATPQGVAMLTRPPAGTALAPGAGLIVVVSRGAPTIAVPDLLGMASADARTRLELEGLQLGTVTRRRTADAAPGIVVGQRPAAGTLAAPGTVVDIVVARSPQ